MQKPNNDVRQSVGFLTIPVGVFKKHFQRYRYHYTSVNVPHV